ncbi:MAG: acyl-CoA synthetase, partial [Actinobacteria bacterium]|nr:acyl-CoA synthetase [Actinomycetota bacterium]
MSTVADLLRARFGDDHAGYVFEGVTVSWDDVVRESTRRAAYLEANLDPDAKPHVGVLLENTPEYLYWIGAAALTGSCIVGINPTRRGAELSRDVRHTDCQMIVTDATGRATFDGVDTGVDPSRHIDVDELRAHLPAFDHDLLVSSNPDGALPLFLLFTSGSTSAPKAVVCTNERMATTAV